MYIPLIVFILMLIFPTLTKSGAYEGLTLWLYTIIPTLLPYMIISGIICYFNAFDIISNILFPATKRLFGITKNANYCLVVGFLCGYPMGSKVISDMLKNKHISLSEANYLLSFCNNISPSFLINYVGISILNNCYNISNININIIILIIFLSPILTSFIYRLLNRNILFNEEKDYSLHTADIANYNFMDKCILNSFENIFKIGGYIIIFTIISTWIQSIKLINNEFCFILSSIFEITSGLNFLKTTNLNHFCGSIIVIGLCSFGGICSIFQTYSMISNSPLKVSKYITYKIVNAILSMFIGIIILYNRL